MPSPIPELGVSAGMIGENGRPAVEPGAFLVTGEDNLRINSWNALAGVVLTITVRFLDETGQIIPYVYTHTPNTNRTKATSDFPLGIGFPLNVSIVASSGAPTMGQTFAQAQIIRGFGGATLALATLLQGYLTAVQALAWPGSPIQNSLDPGYAIRFISGTTPAAGAEISETVPTGARWELLSIKTGFTGGAGAVLRRPSLELQPGGSIVSRSRMPDTIATGVQKDLYWSQGMPLAAAFSTLEIVGGLPTPSLLRGGDAFGTRTENIQAADQYTAPTYVVREWLEVS